MPPATLKLSTLHFRPYPSLTHSLPPHSQKGRIIIITGGARGIGLSIAHAFASTDILALHLLGRDSSTLLSAKPDIGARYPDCEIYTHVTDIADEADVNGAFERIGRLYDGETMVRGYVLVHAAAFLPVPENMDQTSQQGGQEWWQTFETNVKGTFHLLRAVSNLVHTLPPPPPGARQDDDLPPQQATTDGATIINLVSASAYAFTAPGISAYSASKLAAIRMAECVAYEGMAASARIVNLHPGAVETDMWRKSGGEAVGIPCNDGEVLYLFFSYSLFAFLASLLFFGLEGAWAG